MKTTKKFRKNKSTYFENISGLHANGTTNSLNMHCETICNIGRSTVLDKRVFKFTKAFTTYSLVMLSPVFAQTTQHNHAALLKLRHIDH